MRKVKIQWKSVVSSTVCLFLVCLIITVAVAGTHYLTNERILYQQRLNFEHSMQHLLPGERFELIYVDEETDASVYLAFDRNDRVLGCLISTYVMGYGGLIRVLTAIVDSKVYGVEIVDIGKETPGLGTHITHEDFLEQFVGSVDAPVLVREPTSSVGEIQAITGATISSVAVVEAVRLSLEMYYNVVID